MRALVAVASKHGATQGIGAEIARVMRDSGIETDLCQIGDAVSTERYDAFVLGSAVYMGRWMPEAVAFMSEHRKALLDHPVWLFSSGPLGDPPKGSIEPHELDRLMADVEACGHQLFSGSIDSDDLGLKERMVTKVVRAPMGDFRDWDAIGDWARAVAASLVNEPATIS